MEQLKNHAWPGNIRELQNVIERAVLLCDTSKIEEIHLDSWKKDISSEAEDSKPVRLDEVEKRHILAILSHTEGNRTLAAEELGISVRTLRNKLKIYQLR
jgi:DNA-binding NtrC family response regulator